MKLEKGGDDLEPTKLWDTLDIRGAKYTTNLVSLDLQSIDLEPHQSSSTVPFT
jgi:hypothetical protein